MKAIKHIKRVIIHKYYVFIFCMKAGIIWQGFIHDLSKFSPVEMLESIKYYDDNVSPIIKCKEVNGYSKAWMHHKGRNKHHYEYWQDNFDNGGEAVRIPFKYALEQICDYLGAGKVYIGKNFTLQAEYEWWQNRLKRPIAMHPQTKQFTELMLKNLADTNNLEVLNKANAKEIYHRAAVETKTTLMFDEC